ncbi:MAG: pyridine nucleotide-disulfide oxidoreductase [Candidatus Marinimicrobia bacterium]|nr:pyridine nucleotide-disulfide oxidoreductase [Candidatus Neomarinimicrobiota bacterium]
MKNGVVIIGSGHAGGMVAYYLRQKKFLESITIIGDEKYLPYERPELSKQFLDDSLEKEKLFLKTEAFYKKQKIRIIRNCKVRDIDRHKKRVSIGENNYIEYGFLVFATGANLKEIFKHSKIEIDYLKNINHAERLKNQIKNKTSIGIIGGGYIGLEVASIARKKNIATTIIEAENRLMKRVSTPPISEFFSKKHNENKVTIKLDTQVDKISPSKTTNLINCSDKSIVEADIILAAIGVTPNSVLAEKIGLKCSDGILVDEHCLTSDKNILAIGDCSNHFNSIYARQINLQSVHNAAEQAKTAALYITNQRKAYSQVPWFWSNQYDTKLQIAGLSEGYDDLTIIGSKKENSFSVISLRQNQILAVESVNAPQDFVFGKKLIEKEIRINTKELERFLNLRDLYKYLSL